LGGSRGAQILNDSMPMIFSKLNNPNIFIKHQIGQGKSSSYNGTSKVEVTEFIEDMQKAYLWADLCICRAGALTISELIATKTPCILVPYPYAADQHQLANAKMLEDFGAGFIVEQNDNFSEQITDIISLLLKDQNKLNFMKGAYVPYQTPNAVVEFHSYIGELLSA